MSGRKVAVITGASRGIGAATAVEFAGRGHDLTLAALEADELEKTAAKVRSAGATVHLVPGDLSDLDYARSIVNETDKKFGRLDVLVNNAAWREPLPMQRMTIESWDKTLRVTLTAPAFLIKWSAEVMQRHGGGVAINISSVQSKIVSGFGTAYCSAKGAVDVMTYDLAATYGPRGIRVVALNPGAIDTEMSGDYVNEEGMNISRDLRDAAEDMIAMKRYGRADEIAKTIAWLASDDASYITGTTIVADGGLEHQYIPYRLKALMHPKEYR